MKKDIYMIKNTINNKIYIGQAKNTKIRWSGHKSAAKCHGGFIAIDKAMANLGIENFYYEIIEHQIENYDEREKYWISYYDCRIPKGYNYTPGGDGASVGINSISALIKEQKILDEIITELLSNENSIKEIGDKYKVSEKIISAINRGTAYYQDGVMYPIRKRAADFLNVLDFSQIQRDLMYTEKTLKQLAEEYKTSSYIIRQINLGKKFHNENFKYPLRNTKDYPKASRVKEMLKTTDLSLREIGRQCGVSYTMVAHINIGKYHFDKEEHYPIRKGIL